MPLTTVLKLLSGSTFVLMLVGGWVHTVGASLACPDWPRCFGQWMPPMVGDVLLEHGHRMLATAVGAATLGLALTLQAQGRPARLRRGAWLGLGLVVWQGLLGGLTVLWRLPPAVSILHLASSMVFFAWTVWFQFVCTPPAPAGAAPALARGRVVLATAVVYLQVVLGAVVRHVHASLACGLEAVTCAGGLLPTTGLQLVQTAHRVLALVALGLVVWATLPAIKLARSQHWRGLRRLGIALHALVSLQILLGAMTLWTQIQLHVVSAHLALGSLLWAGMVAFCLALGPEGWRWRRPAGPGAPAAAGLGPVGAGLPRGC